MRALLVIVGVVVFVLLLAIGLGLWDTAQDRTRAEAVPVENGEVDMRAEGPGFEVEAGTLPPGRASPPDDADEPAGERLAEGETSEPASAPSADQPEEPAAP